uniref:Kinetochore protein Nuf2 N-terminal domain-containing protein n=1 Tax=Bactrocera dorsalis TaxID=27457 RepID=A0A034V3C9_BACDO
MLSKEYLDSWNELCAECKMVESDLANPSEKWLTKVLVSYLRMFGYRVEIPCSEEGSREKRIFLIKLVRHIDHIYKISDKSFTFTYYDLLKPSTKKTSHMLGILLNYLYYMNMFKTDVFKMANDRLAERQELVDKIKHTIEDNRKRQNKAEKMHEELAFLSNQIPLHKNQLKSVTSELSRRESESQQITIAVKDLKTEIDELKGKVRNLKRLIVPEKEGQELQIQLNKIQEQITEYENQTRNAESNLKTHISDNNRLQEILKLVESAKDILSSDFVDSFNKSVNNLLTAETKVASCEKERVQLTQTNIQHEKTLECLQEKIKLQQHQFDEEKQKLHTLIMSKTKECDDLEAQTENLKCEVGAVENSINEQQDIQSYIQENIGVLMENYK